MSSAESFASRIAAGLIGPDEIAILQKGFSAYIANDGEIPLEHCLRMPRTTAAIRRASRDEWLRRAWMATEGYTNWGRSAALAREVDNFLVNHWPTWRERDEPPGYATEQRAALFWAAKTESTLPSSSVMINNICRPLRKSKIFCGGDFAAEPDHGSINHDGE